MEIWKAFLPAPWPLMRWISASPKPLGRDRVAHRVLVGRAVELGLHARARLEVDAEVQALAADGERADEQDHARHREEPLRRAHVVEAPALALLADAQRRRAVDEPRAPHRAQHGLGQQHRGEEGDQRADAQREGEALDPGGGQQEEDERDHEGHDVGVDDRRQAALVARGDRGRDRSAAAQLFLDAFEDDDVRVGRDADGEDQARDARQRHRDRDELDQRVEEDRVDDEGADRDDAEHAVEDQQEERDDDEAGDAGDQALVQRLLAQRRRHLRGRDELQLDRQRAGLQQVGQPLRRLDGEAAGDLRAAAGREPVRVLLPLDLRRRDELVVEHDREVLVGRVGGRAERLLLAALRELLGERLPRARAAAGEVEEDVRAPVPPAPLSKLCSGFLMSLPPSTVWSFRTYQRFDGLPFGSSCSARTRVTPCGTVTIWSALKGSFLACASRSRSARLSSGPTRTCLVFLSTR